MPEYTLYMCPLDNLCSSFSVWYKMRKPVYYTVCILVGLVYRPVQVLGHMQPADLIAYNNCSTIRNRSNKYQCHTK